MKKSENKILHNKTVLITGGTGTFGKNFAKFLLANYSLKKLIIFSRDEFKQHELEKEIKDKRIRFFLGDVRDRLRMDEVLVNVDIVIHAAALKQVPRLEYTPSEAIKTNVIGSENVIKAALVNKVDKVILISTDKAAQPINLYGATKLCAEKLFVAINALSPKGTKFSVVRYGNVIGSRGSIIETILNNNNQVPEKVYITDPKMTRFWISLDETFSLIMFALKHMLGGEIFVPLVPSMKITELFNLIAPTSKIEVVGIRPGEKLHEILLTEQESRHSVKYKNHYIILAEFAHQWSTNLYKKYFQTGVKLKPGFIFSSNTNKNWITKKEIRQIIHNQKLGSLSNPINEKIKV